VKSPERKPCARNPNYGSQSLGLGVKAPVAEQLANEGGDLVLLYRQVNQAESPVTKAAVIEVIVAGEEGWAALLKQKRNDLVVLHAALTQVKADLMNVKAAPFQELPLVGC
jgi:hypothetical protein